VTDERTSGRADVQKSGRAEERTSGFIDRQIDRWMGVDGWIYGRTDGAGKGGWMGWVVPVPCRRGVGNPMVMEEGPGKSDEYG
jgi:hypothetical protein